MTDIDRQILEFESQWWRTRGNKESAIQQQFGWSIIRHYQRLNQIIDLPEAMAIDPMTVNRLHRLREQRTRARRQRAGYFQTK